MLVLLGANHRSAPLAFRERVAVSASEVADCLERLVSLEGASEAFLLSTCNRTEVIVRCPDARSGFRAVRQFLSEDRGIGAEEIERYTYAITGSEAVRHLFNVSSGLDSMILGEPQITGQVKQAYFAAQAAGTTGQVIEKLMQSCLAAAKRVRTETEISRHPVSVASTAVKLTRQIFDRLDNRSALLLGAGKMSGLVARHLTAQGVRSLVVASRTFNRAAAFAERFGGTAVNWEEAWGKLAAVDIVISGTASPGAVLHKADVQKAMRARRARPLFVMDIAVPRDVDPEVNELSNVYLYDIDDLQTVVDSNLESRTRSAEAAAKIVAEEVARFDRWLQSQAVAPTIVSLRESLLRVGEEEVARFRRRLGPMTAGQEQALQEMSRAIVQKILHRPIRRLKASVERGDTARTAEWFHEVFGIEVGEEPKPRSGSVDAPADKPATEARGASGPRSIVRGGKDD